MHIGLMFSHWLEWAVVAVPIIVGLMQWVIPIRDPKRSHKVSVLIGCVLFSILIWWQQNAARQEHLSEFSKLPTKDDLKRLPSASEIVREFKRIAPAGVNQTPWGLTDEQLAKLTERVSVYAPFVAERNSGLVSCVMGDQDGLKFAQRIANAFRAAHWKGTDGVGQGVFGGVVEGVIVQIRDKDDHPPGLSEFVQTLRESGIDATGQIDTSIPHDEFHILVGSRPSPK